MQSGSMLGRFSAVAVAVGLALGTASTSYAQVQTQATETQRYDIHAGDLTDGIKQFGIQSRLQLLAPPELLKGLRGKQVSGQYSARQALDQLLTGSGLSYEFVNATTVVIKPGAKPKPPETKLPPRNEKARPQAQGEQKVTELPEILVTGTRSLNTDIERTRDDVQPYVVFDRETIERSGAVSVDDFLKQRLPMNARARSDNQGHGSGGNRSRIDLRGLGTGQTLILIDGRRTSNTVQGGDLLQADLNGIPLAAIERIEVLPTTASGIYGGDATGGVINVILRRDYKGSEVRLTWDNTFDTDTAQPRIDLSTGFNLGENTNVMVTASRSQGNVLMNRDRDFVEDYRRRAFANNPSLYLPPASAPLGAVPNLRSADGSNLVLDDGTPLGSHFTHVPSGYTGAHSDGGAALLANAGTYDFRLANSSQRDGGRQALLNAPKVTSANATIRHTFTPKVEGFLELAASNNNGRFISNNLPSEITLPADAPNNPFQQDLQVRVPLPTQDFAVDNRDTDRRVTGGVIVKLQGEWLAEVDYVWSQTRSRSVQEVYGLSPEGVAALQDGTLDILSDPNAFPLELSPYLIRPGTVAGPYETTTRSPTLLLGGPVGSLPGGEPRLSLRLEHRDEDFAEAAIVDPVVAGVDPFQLVFPSKSQTVSSAFAEWAVPLFSSLNARPGLQELDVQLSVRHDRYTVEGATGVTSSPTEPITRIDNELSSTNFTAGLRWKPIQDLMLRASYGTGFLPPNVNQLVPNNPFTWPAGFFVDPRRGNTPVGEFQARTGGSPNLQPEESESLSAGVILTPRILPGLRLSVDYIRIEKDDNISSIPGGFQGLLENEALFPGQVIRGANLPGDPAGWAGPVTFMDQTLVNIARAEVEAYDVQLDYAWDTARWGNFNFFVVATWQTHYRTQLLQVLPIVENVGLNGLQDDGSSPLKLKGNVGVNWQHRNWRVGWVSRYFDAYRPYFGGAGADTIASSLQTQGASKVNDQLYHDLTVQYAFDGNGWLGRLSEGLSVQFGVRNVFNKAPPRDLTSYSFYGDPRLASYWLTLSKSFSY